jgi:hypothetical protein
MVNLEQEVEMTWSNNRRFYEIKGYKYTHKGEKFLIKIKDLSPHSLKRINIICDYCGKEYNITYNDYTKYKNNSLIDKDCCIYCRDKKIFEAKSLNTKTFSNIYEEFRKRNYILVGVNSFPIFHDKKLFYICQKHNNIIQSIDYYHFLNRNQGCKFCYYKSRTGEGNNRWNGGITSLTNFLRNQINDWKYDSLKASNFQCCLSRNKTNLVIHHLYSFGKIVKETIKELQIDLRKNTSQYSDEELKLLTDKCLELHYKHGLGVVITQQNHLLYHKIYKYHGNTPAQFEEFRTRYLSGEFNDQLM